MYTFAHSVSCILALLIESLLAVQAQLSFVARVTLALALAVPRALTLGGEQHGI